MHIWAALSTPLPAAARSAFAAGCAMWLGDHIATAWDVQLDQHGMAAGTGDLSPLHTVATSPCPGEVPSGGQVNVFPCQEGVGQRPKRTICPTTEEPTWLLLPSLSVGTREQGCREDTLSEKPSRGCGWHTREQGRPSSSLHWLSWLTVRRGSSCKRPPSFCLLFSPVKTTPLLYTADKPHMLVPFAQALKKTWPVCQSWAFDCMIDYQPPNWIHEDSSPALWPEFQKYIHKGVTFKDVSMTLWCFSQ